MSGPLRVSLDVSAVPAQPAGAGRYTLELARAVSAAEGVTLTLISRRADAARWARLAPRARLVAEAPDARPVRLAWEQVGLSRRLGRLGIEVHHGPHYTLPERAATARVATVHDCTFFDHPEWHERSKVLVFRRAIRTAASRAEVVVCPSASTAEALAGFVPVPAQVRVIPHGVDGSRFHPRPGEGDRGALDALGLRGPYVAFVGTVEPRKDVPTLIAAFDRVAARHPELHLVIAGQPGWGGAEAEVLAAMGRAVHAGRMHRVGYLADATVPALLRAAAAVAYPSLVEGFGLPALEALACAAPLVTTVGTAMAEVAGPAALLVPPGDARALADALDETLAGGPQVEDRRRDGIRRAAGYTWAASARAHLEAYAEALDRHGA